MDKFSSFVALRYMKTDRRNRFFSWIALLSVVGVTISVAAMIVVLSVIEGFEVELRKRFLHANAHILAFKYPNGLADYDSYVDKIKRDFGDQMTGASPFVHYETMIRKGPVINGVLVRGIHPKKRESVQSLKQLVISPEGSNALDELQKEIDNPALINDANYIPGIILGSGLLKIINAKFGDTVQLISPKAETVSETKSFRIVGIYDSGLKHYDNKLAALSLKSAQSFFGMGDRVIGIEIGLKDPDKSPEIAAAMEAKYALSVREWQSFNQPLFKAMETEKWVIALIVWLIGLVAGFNILMTILVSVTQKQRDISILKALGASNLQIISLFLKQGSIIGVVGSFFGIILALILAYILKTYQFIELPDPYFLSSLPVQYDPMTYIIVPIAAVLICVLSGLYPSIIASRVLPTEGIRGIGKGAV